MVGDGINDSAVLAQADLGIAMGQGSDIAIDVEKVTILSSDLTKIAAAVRLSAATVRTVRQNLFWAFIYNLIGVPVAAGVLYPLTRFLLNSMLVGAAMALSSVSVVANSLQLSTKRLGTKAVHKINTEFITKKQTAMKKEYRIEVQPLPDACRKGPERHRRSPCRCYSRSSCRDGRIHWAGAGAGRIAAGAGRRL